MFSNTEVSKFQWRPLNKPHIQTILGKAKDNIKILNTHFLESNQTFCLDPSPYIYDILPYSNLISQRKTLNLTTSQKSFCSLFNNYSTISQESQAMKSSDYLEEFDNLKKNILSENTKNMVDIANIDSENLLHQMQQIFQIDDIED